MAAKEKFSLSPEVRRLEEDTRRVRNWKRWGPYLAERQWGTVREDYSPGGTCWDYFPHDHARSRTYRWGEDGLLGVCDREGRLCFALALWNGRDPIFKERLFGLSGPEGNHGEDVKEAYFYLDSTPTHSYMKALYKYPQGEFPYQQLLEENRRRARGDAEFELGDSNIFRENRYFDVLAEYAKNSPDDILIRLTISNRSPEPATLVLLPTLWFRNTWSWSDGTPAPQISVRDRATLRATHQSLGNFCFAAGSAGDKKPARFLFTENETNSERIFDVRNRTPFVKDAFHEFVVQGNRSAVNPGQTGTKAAIHYQLEIPAQGEVVLPLRLCREEDLPARPFGRGFDKVFEERIAEGEQFQTERLPARISKEENRVVRQAYAGLLWSKQFYHYVV